MSIPFNPEQIDQLDRFVKAQEPVWPVVLNELQNERKESHWMWFIFPQLRSLGRSPVSHFFGLADLLEAEDYLTHPVLGKRLIKCTEILMQSKSTSAHGIFGHPDDLKLRSSMTVFSECDCAHDNFEQVLGKFFAGEADLITLSHLGSAS